MLEYSQNIIEKKCVFTKGNLTENLSFISGKRIETENCVKIRPYKNVLDLSQCLKELDKFIIPDFIKLSNDISKLFRHDNLDMLSLLKFHQEYININDNIEDLRKYISCRLVFSDEHNKFFEEFPLDMNTAFLEEKFHSSANKYKTYLKKEKTNPEKFEVNSIPVILSPQATGYFIHEIIGHLLEEDMYLCLKTSLSSFYDNDFNFNHKLTVVDSVDIADNFLGLSKYDDAGTPIKPITLISDGKIKNILATSTETSYDGKIYGVERRQSYKYSALPRMRSTFAKTTGVLSQEEIIGKHKNAFFMEQVYMGNCLPITNTYTLYGYGFFVENGEIVSDVCNFSYSSNIVNDLNSVINVGNDFKLFSSDCIKGDQVVRVCMGGPTISMKEGCVKGERYK